MIRDKEKLHFSKLTNTSIFGYAGSGKTFFLHRLFNELADKGYLVTYIGRPEENPNNENGIYIDMTNEHDVNEYLDLLISEIKGLVSEVTPQKQFLIVDELGSLPDEIFEKIELLSRVGRAINLSLITSSQSPQQNRNKNRSLRSLTENSTNKIGIGPMNLLDVNILLGNASTKTPLEHNEYILNFGNTIQKGKFNR